MGLDYNAAKFLLFAKSQDGTDFSEVATLGHQCLYLSPKELRYLIVKFFGDIDDVTLNSFYRGGNPKAGEFTYAERFF